MEGRKILCIIGQLGNGGTERQLYLFLKHLDRSRYDAMVLVSGEPNGRWLEPIQSLGVQVRGLGKAGFLRKMLAFRKIMAEFEPDLAFSWSFFTNIFRMACPSTPFVGSLRGDLNAARKNIGIMKWRLCLLPDGFVVNSSLLKQQLVDRGIRREKISLVGNIIDPSEIPLDNGDRRRIRGKFGIPKDAKVIVGAGRDTREKNLPLFLDVFESLRRRRSDLFGFILGDCQKTIGKQVRDRRLDGQLFLPGEVENPFEFYRAADLFFLSSRTEGMPNALLEALSCGCVAVAMDTGGIRDLLPGDGLVSQDTDPNTVASRILSCLDSGIGSLGFELRRSAPQEIMDSYYAAILNNDKTRQEEH